MENMKNKTTQIMTIFTIVLLSFTYTVSADEIDIQNITLCPCDTITVPDDYQTIQEAIDNAESGDCIYVKN